MRRIRTLSAVFFISIVARGQDGVSPAPAVDVLGRRVQPHAPPKAPYVAGSITRKERLHQPGASSADALRESPGVQVEQLGGLGAPATASVRGATASQTVVYLGGTRINDEVGGAANLADVPLFLVDRMEVYRSHAPSASELAPGGAIFFELERPDDDRLKLSVLGGSFATRAASAYVSRGSARRGLLAGVEVAAAENAYEFRDSRGTLFVDGDDRPTRLANADARTGQFWLIAREPIGASDVTLLVNRATREQGAPKLALVRSERARVAFERTLVALGSRVPVEEWSGNVQVATTAVEGQTVIDDPLAELGLLSARTRTPGERIEQRVAAEQHFGTALEILEEISVSLERLRRIELRRGSHQTTLSARRLALRIAVAAELELAPQFHAGATLAAGCYGTSAADSPSCDREELNGRAGASLRSETWDVYLNAGSYRRRPTLSELYGTSLLVRGNELLRPERGTTAELGARKQVLGAGRRRLMYVDAAAFARLSRDLISFVPTAQGYLHPQNRNSARTLGAEIVVGSEALDVVEAEASASLLDPRDTSATRVTQNDVLPFLSRLTFTARAGVRTSLNEKLFDEARFGIKYAYQSARYGDAAGLAVLPEQSSVDFEAELLGLERHAALRVRMSNAFDSARFDVVGFPLPGRSVFVELEVTW